MDDVGMSDVVVPLYDELLLPTLRTVFDLGGCASISEIVESVIKDKGLSEDQQAILHNDGPETEIGYRLAWALTYLKGMSLLTNSQRGGVDPTAHTGLPRLSLTRPLKGCQAATPTCAER
jgi:restriction system protein